MKNYILYFGFIFFIGIASYGQSKIERAEESLKNKETTTRNSISKNNKNRSNNDSDNDFLTEVVGGFFVQIFVHTIYAAAFESPFEMNNKATNAFISKHPYYNSKKGNYTYASNKNTPIFRTTLSTKYISENSRVKGAHFNLDMRFLKRLGLELDYLQL